MHMQPYLMFDGRCEEAIEFYHKALGAEVGRLLRFKDCPEPMPKDKLAPGSENKIMHASLRIGDTTFFASDGTCTGQPNFQGFSLSLSAGDAAQAERLFNALAEGGKVRMPLGNTFFAFSFGMVTDKFGVPWMVIVPK